MPNTQTLASMSPPSKDSRPILPGPLPKESKGKNATELVEKLHRYVESAFFIMERKPPDDLALGMAVVAHWAVMTDKITDPVSWLEVMNSSNRSGWQVNWDMTPRI